ncbi:MAG: hypothetical protein IPP93_09745 [Chitinophagaceae bacterium]|nr:hypothetical protein [Chitinophagaceae bacterium]
MKLTSLIITMILLPIISFSQVKIGDPTGLPDPKAILELKDSTRGFLLPRLTQAQMNGIASPTDGLLLYNTSANNIYQYKQAFSQWRPIVADSSEWFHDTASNKLYLRRALNNTDSFYYNVGLKKFVYADTRYYRTGYTGIFNLDEGNSDRFIFKTTASRYPRPLTNLFSANGYFVYEVDNDTIALAHPFEASYIGLAADASVTGQATQRISELIGMRAVSSFTGSDSILGITGFSSNVTTRGKGYQDVITGINNATVIRDSVQQIGLLFGINNTVSYSSPLGTPRVLGDYYGYVWGASTAFNNKVDGNAYGILLRNVAAAAPGRNYGVFTNKGVNHFGDSVLVTNLSAFKPREVFDVFSTSSMIIPVGTTAQRPAITYLGMLRYNSDIASPEAFNGSGWINLKSPALSATAILDPPIIANFSTSTVNYTITGAAFGNTVTISPDVALPNGIVIAWAQVSAANTVTIGFSNFSGVPVDLPAQNFYIKVIQ